MAKANDPNKETDLEHANEAHRDNRTQRNLTEVKVEDASILSRLMLEVDTGKLQMPDARREIGNWYNAFDVGRDAMKIELRARMRRLKQIVDAMSEEVATVTSQQ